MPLIVCFQSAKYAPGNATELCIAQRVRTRESIATGGTGSATAQDGEIAVLYSTEGATIVVAHGSTPDASATSATSATSAAYNIPPDQLVPVQVRAGDKFAVAS